LQYLTFFQAKLRTLHEVVVRNRLEQLRKRQRDEALQAQEELMAGVAKSAASNFGNPALPINGPNPEDDVEKETIEEYRRSMSPDLIDITRLPMEDRQMDILTEKEDRLALVSPNVLFLVSALTTDFPVPTTPCRHRLSICTESCATSC
jgi:hypothetical protein